MTDEQQRTDAESLQPSASKVPSDFAARVLAARGRAINVAGDSELVPPSFWTSRSTVMASAVVASACVLALGVAMVRGRGAASSVELTGKVHTTTRTSVPIGRRGVAVAEPGADLTFVAGPRSATVTQRVGNVFYRVETGGPVTVETPVGTVQATNACFRITIEESLPATANLKPEYASNIRLGAQVATIAVYQGEVLVGGSERASPGQQVRLSSAGVSLIIDAASVPHSSAD